MGDRGELKEAEEGGSGSFSCGMVCGTVEKRAEQLPTERLSHSSCAQSYVPTFCKRTAFALHACMLKAARRKENLGVLDCTARETLGAWRCRRQDNATPHGRVVSDPSTHPSTQSLACSQGVLVCLALKLSVPFLATSMALFYGPFWGFQCTFSTRTIYGCIFLLVGSLFRIAKAPPIAPSRCAQMYVWVVIVSCCILRRSIAK